MRSQVRFLLGPPVRNKGALAQLVERLPCKEEVRSSILLCSTAQTPWLRLGGLLVVCDVRGLNDKMCVWLGVSWGLDLAFLDAD